MIASPLSDAILKLYLFGPARLERNGEAARFETKKALALLAYLVVEGPQTRDQAANLFWPDHDIARARGTLRRTLSAIRSASGDRDLLDADRERIAVRLDRIWVDVIEFRRLLESGQVESGRDALANLKRAVELGRAELLGGVSLRGAYDFEHWQYRTQETLQRELATALKRLVEIHYEQGHPESAIPHAVGWNELDPLHESGHRWLMRLYAETGDRSGAIEQYHRCVRVLAEELAVGPTEETTRLYESLTAGTPATTASERRPTSVSVPAELPLVGRATEEKLLRDVAETGSRLVVIEGEAGIGKTRLARLLIDLVSATGRNVVEVRCHEEESGHAFGIATRLLHRALDAASTSTVANIDPLSAGEARRLLPELSMFRDDLPQPESLDSPGAQTAFFHGLWETVMTLLGDNPAILIDDVQWSDAGSTEFLAYGIRRLERLPVIVVVTLRSEEVGPEDILRRVLAEAQRAGTAESLAPRRLSADDVAALVAEINPQATGLAPRLFEETEGVPFFISEYLKVATAEDEWPIASGVAQLIRTQVARISEIANQVLTAASVIGRDLSIELLEAVSGRSVEETTDAIDELERRGLLVLGATNQAYDFSHEKVREVVFADTSLARRRLLHSRAATHLQNQREIAPAAYHAQQAGHDEAAAQLYADAGSRARDLFANEEALAHLQAAIGLGHPDAAGLHEAIGDVQTLLGRYRDALASYQAALAFSTEVDVAARLERQIGRLFLRRGEEASAEAHLRRAAEESRDPAQKSRALADLALATTAYGGGDPERIAQQALAAAKEAGDAAALARADNVIGLLAARRGALDEARSRLQASVEGAAQVGDPSLEVAALNNLALTERDAGNPVLALELLERAIKLCESQGDLHRAAALHNNAADILHAKGNSAESEAQSRRAAELFAQVGEPFSEPGIWKLVTW
ncbi:MAG: BTAD domain-containing putative transcriptional regulator [Actinomycetota bacterium]